MVYTYLCCNFQFLENKQVKREKRLLLLLMILLLLLLLLLLFFRLNAQIAIRGQNVPVFDLNKYIYLTSHGFRFMTLPLISFMQY